LPTAKIHPILSPWGRFGLYSFFIDAPEPAIIDTGIAISPQTGILPALEDLGHRLEEIQWILLTHGHIDHIGGAFAMWEATNRRAQVAIHRDDADMLRQRQAHVDAYVRIRQQYLNDPDGVAKQETMLTDVISGEMEPTLLLEGGETLDLGGGTTVSVHHTPGHTPGSTTFVLDDQRAAFVGDAVQASGAANGFPGYEDPTTYRNSLLHLRDTVQPEEIYLGHPFRNMQGQAYDVHVQGDLARGVLQESLDVEARIANLASRQLETGLSNGDAAYDPFAAVAEGMGYSGDPTLEPSPFFTTLNGYRQAMVELRP
jgi:hydroxyacylglutathione hydrolase